MIAFSRMSWFSNMRRWVISSFSSLTIWQCMMHRRFKMSVFQSLVSCVFITTASVSYQRPWQNWPSGPHPRPTRRWKACCRAQGRCRGTDEPVGPSARHGSQQWLGHAGGTGRSDERTWTTRQQCVNDNLLLRSSSRDFLLCETTKR